LKEQLSTYAASEGLNRSALIEREMRDYMRRRDRALAEEARKQKIGECADSVRTTDNHVG